MVVTPPGPGLGPAATKGEIDASREMIWTVASEVSRFRSGALEPVCESGWALVWVQRNVASAAKVESTRRNV